ncbi:hypothetical protein B0H11DRAFT_2091370 [Mycena galericulata]|nr:hypothetical protein B0H11DRAFT_2091370 [Mycena galericulata]
MASLERECPHCKGLYNVKGLGNHQRKCADRQSQAKQNREFVETIQGREVEALVAEIVGQNRGHPRQHVTPNTIVARDPDSEDYPTLDCGPAPAEQGRNSDESGPQLDDIKRIFHPHSQRPPINISFQDYRNSQVPPERRPPLDNEPWVPFRTRLDFEFAEFAQDAMLNRNQTKTLISLLRRCIANPQGFTIETHSDLEKQWELASKKCTQFEKYDVAVPYKGVDHIFEMYARPLWSWTLDLIQDPRLADFFVWDAEKAFIYNGKKYVRFFTEPWTADAMWDIQSKIPDSPDHKLCPYIIYADKAKLSSFASQKGYPIIARLANMVVSLRNSSEWGGGQIVGWLPVVEEDQAEASKPGYVNFKNAVWHKSFYKLLESIVASSKAGEWTQCGDGHLRCLYPMILIKACDYEEACVMALIRGLQALYPCPICYIKAEDQSDTTIIAPLRTGHQSQGVIKKARKLNAEGRENLLKSHGLRNVDNVFWSVAYSDPHQGLSFEHLHSYSLGLWGKHLFPRIKKHAERISSRTGAKIDEQYSAFPRWRNLNHFDSVMSMSFNDGTKFEDVSKMIILASHNILVEEIDVLLLQLCRSYQELSLYITLKLHTDNTIGDGREEFKNFGCLLKLYIDACPDDEFLGDGKNWNFPKIHAHQHAFDDIVRKGVSRNFGAKIDEAMHASTRNTYLRQTNFKNVAPQILKSEHRTLVAKFIRDQLNDLDNIWDHEWDGSGDVDNTESKVIRDEAPQDTEKAVGNAALGSKQLPISLGNLEGEMAKTDTAFQRFRLKLSEFLNEFLPAYGHPLPGGKRVNLHTKDQITPYRFLKVFYESLEDWSNQEDYLRCNPSFHGRPRFDGALVKTTTGNLFVRLVYIFQISLEEKNYPLALVQPLDAPLGRVTKKDRALKLYRVRAKPRQASEFISVHSIVRGAVLVPDSAKRGDFLVMDVLDPDMFFRLRDTFPWQ